MFSVRAGGVGVAGVGGADRCGCALGGGAVNRLERAVLAVAALCILLGVIGWVSSSTAEKPVSPLIAAAIEKGYMPCPTEDALLPCYWDASRQGNGEGRSFVWTGDETFYE